MIGDWTLTLICFCRLNYNRDFFFLHAKNPGGNQIDSPIGFVKQPNFY